jgi:hypothetical protein
MSLRPVLFVTIAWAWGALAHAADRPISGFLYNTSESSGLVYNCSVVRPDEITCEFTQTSVRREADPKDLQKKLQEARSEFASGKPLSAEECSGFEKFLKALRTGDTSGMPNPTETSQQFAAMQDGEKKALMEVMSAVASFCRTPSEENYLNLAKTSFLRQTRTCLAASNTFQQTFKRVRMSDTWTSNEGPKGTCGVVDISRFEADKSSKPFLFRYITRKIVTAPQGEGLLGLQRSDLDTREYTYDWRSKEHHLSCDIIKFSPI